MTTRISFKDFLKSIFVQDQIKMLFKINKDIKTTVVDPNKKAFGTY